MGEDMQLGDVMALCGWFFVFGGAGAFGALFGMAIFDFVKAVLKG